MYPYHSFKVKPAVRIGTMGRYENGKVIEVEHNIQFADFLINGESLYERFKERDFISPLGVFVEKFQDDIISQLLLEKPSELPSGRYQILVCPLCGDVECGALTADIERDGDGVVWKNFGFQDSSEGEVELIKNYGPFRFEWEAYENAIRSTFNMFGPYKPW